MSDRAVILAGGKGTRLHPYTVAFPKPLVPVGEYPVLEIIIRQLRRAGITRVTLAVNHHANLIQAYFGDGEAWGLRIDYSRETEALSTIAPLRLIPDLPESFLLMNGDVLTDLDYRELWQAHRAADAMFTVAASTRRHTTDYGVLEVDASGRRLTGFREKPTSDFHVSMGVYVVDRRVVDGIPPTGPYGFDDLMLDLLARDAPVYVHQHPGYWLDIGRPDDYARAADEFGQLRARLLPDG